MTPAPIGRKTVLIVEDSPTEQAMIADCLHEAGYSVVLAGDGDEVGEKMRSVAIDLVVLDLILPRVVSAYCDGSHTKNTAHLEPKRCKT